MSKPFMTMCKGLLAGMVVGAVLGAAGKTAADENSKVRKKIVRIKRTAGDVADTARYMFK